MPRKPKAEQVDLPAISSELLEQFVTLDDRSTDSDSSVI